MSSFGPTNVNEYAQSIDDTIDNLRPQYAVVDHGPEQPMEGEPLEADLAQGESVINPDDPEMLTMMNDLLRERMNKRMAASQQFQEKAASLNRQMWGK